MYFSEFPKIFYDLPIKGSETTLQVLTDITVNVRVRKEILENITLYDEYDIKDSETPEIIAEKYYGNPEYHWIIMLVNERYDYHNDFPLSSEELYLNSINKYGSVANLDQVHHYEKDGLTVQAQGVLKVNDTVYNQIKVNDIVQNPHVFGRVLTKSVDQTNYYISVQIEKGKFVAGENLIISGIRENEVTGDKEYAYLDTYIIPQNAFTLATGYFPITNYQHEDIQNEKKRRIKLISPQLIQQVVKELRTLIGE